MKPSLLKRAATSASLSLLFLLVYGLCNHLTSLRSHVGSINLPWEINIPFLPLFILPYMSLDLFFIAAPFLTKSNRELSILAKRIAAAILLAALVFLLAPTQFNFPRPDVDGPLGLLFNPFRALDPPYNEFPSLHIALCLILADTCLRHVRNIVLHSSLSAWFTLIFLSPLFTYQHHFLDLLGGIALAALCIHAFDFAAPAIAPAPTNPRIARYYALGTLFLVAVSFVFTPWSYLLLWPAFSLTLATLAYLTLGSAIYRKHDGKLTWTTWLLLWPLLLGQRLSLLYYARTSLPYNKLTDRLWIGRQLSARQTRFFTVAGIRAVLDLTCEFSEIAPLRDHRYLQLPVLDLTAPTPLQIEQALAFIDLQARYGIVYVHCKIGFSRTAVIAGAYLLSTGQAASPEEAVALLRQARPGIIIRPEAVRALQKFAAHCPLNSA